MAKSSARTWDIAYDENQPEGGFFVKTL